MTNPAFNAPRGRLPSIEWVPIADLHIDDTYQRSIETKASSLLIASIAADWDWDLLDVLKVSRRDRDDRLFVIDGQHRKAAAAVRGDIHQLPCVVKRCTGPTEEAKLFVASNRRRKTMSVLDDFRAAVGAGDAEAVAIERMATAAGFTIPRAQGPRGATVAGELANVGPIRTAIRKRGEAVVAQTLMLMGEAFPDELIVHPTAIMTAIVELIAIARLDYDRLFQALLSRTTVEWATWAGIEPGQGGITRTIAMRAAIQSRYDAIGQTIELEEAA